MAGWTRRACSWPTRCWLSTTRTTCRRRCPNRCAVANRGSICRRRHNPSGVISMLPEIGQYALILALLLAAAQAFFGLAGPWRGQQRWMQAVYPAVAGQFVLIALAF